LTSKSWVNFDQFLKSYNGLLFNPKQQTKCTSGTA